MADNVFPPAGGGVSPPTQLTEWNFDAASDGLPGAPFTAAPDTALNTVLDIAGSGVLTFLNWLYTNTTSRTVTMIVTVDDVVVLNSVIVTPGTGGGLSVVGFSVAGDTGGSIGQITFNRSLKVEVQTSVMGTFITQHDHYLT